MHILLEKLTAAVAAYVSGSGDVCKLYIFTIMLINIGNHRLLNGPVRISRPTIIVYFYIIQNQLPYLI